MIQMNYILCDIGISTSEALDSYQVILIVVSCFFHIKTLGSKRDGELLCHEGQVQVVKKYHYSSRHHTDQASSLTNARSRYAPFIFDFSFKFIKHQIVCIFILACWIIIPGMGIQQGLI